MGTFLYPVTIRNPQAGASLRLEAVVDSGATFTSVPGSLLQQLGVAPIRTATMQPANGSLVEIPLGYVEVAVGDDSTLSPCLFGTEGSPATLGSTTLQSLLLSPDIVNHRLVKTPGLLVSQRVVEGIEEDPHA